MSAVERKLQELEELVDDPYEPRSHRNRLHKLEGTQAGHELVEAALNELRGSWGRRVREWSSLAIALAAIIYTIASHS